MSHRYRWPHRTWNGDPSGPHVTRAVVDHVVVTAFTVVDHITVSPVSLNGFIGFQSQLTGTAFASNGQIIPGATVTWLSDHPEIASVDGTGLVTYNAAGTASISALVDGRSYNTVAVVSSVDEVTYLRTNLPGGDSAMLALYSALSGVSQSGGQVTTWNDARGSVGFGPSLTPDVGGNGLSVNGSDPATMYLRSDAGKRLYSPASSLFDLSAAKAICLVGTTGFSPATDAYPIVISKDVADISNYLGIDATNLIREGLIGVVTLPGPSRVVSSRAKSAKIRLTIVARDAANEYVQVPPLAVLSGSVSAAGSGTARLLVGFGASNPIDEKYRAILVLPRVPTTSDVPVLVNWARNYHPAVNAQ